MNISTFFSNAKRVFLVAKKPTAKEYWGLAKIVGIGILAIGFIGFLITLLLYLFYMP